MPSTQPELASQHAGVPAQQHQQQQQQPLQFVAGHPISPATLATMAAAHQIQMQQLKAATSMQADAGAPAAADASMMVDDTTISAAASKLHVKAESPATVATAAAGGLEVPLLSPTHHVRLESTTSMAMDTTTTATATAATPVFSPTRAMPVVAAAIPIMMASGSTAHHATVAAGGHRAILLHQQQQHSYQQHDSEDDSDEDDDHPHLAQQYRPTSAAAAGVRSKKSKSARVSCHQCKTTKEDGLLLFCTTKAEKGLRKRKCRKKYCDACLRRSYNMSIGGLTPSEIATYCCPACHGTCSCAACQRKQIETMARRGGGVVDPPMMSGVTSQQAGAAGGFMSKVTPQQQQQQATAATAVGHGVQGGVGMGYSMFTSGYLASAVPSATAGASSATAATEVPASAAMAFAGVPISKSQHHMHAQLANSGARGSAHLATAVVQPAISVSVNAPPASSHRPLNGLTSPASQPLSSPSESSSSVSTSGLTLSLAQLQTTGAAGHSAGGLQNDSLHTVGASATPPGSQGATSSPRVQGLQMQIPSAATGGKDPSTIGFNGSGGPSGQQPDSEMMTQLSLTKDPTSTLSLAQQHDPTSLSLAQQQKMAAAAAATTQAEIEEKTRQLQDLLARRMSQDPNFLANLRPNDPLQIIKSIMQGGNGGGAHSGGVDHRRHSSSGAAAMEDDDGGSHPHGGLPAEEWEEHARGHANQQHQRRMKYHHQMQEKQTAMQAQMAQHLLPADAPIHAALSVPMKSRALSATSKRAAAAAAAQAAAMQAGDPASLPFPPKARGSSTGGKPARAPKVAGGAAAALAGSPASGEAKRIYRRKGPAPQSPYQRLDGDAAEKERARRMSPVTQYEYGAQAANHHVLSRGANSAPSSQRTSPALKPRSKMMDHPSMMDGEDNIMMMMQDHMMYEEGSSGAEAMSPSNRSVMSPSDPNYHRWLAKRHQAAAGDAAGTGSSDEAQAAALHHSNSYNQRLLQAHKLLMEQSQRARESRNQDRHSESELNSARDAPREQRDYGGYEYSQSVPPPSMTVDVGSRYPNHSSSAYPQTPNQPGGHGLFSPPAHGGNSGGLFSPPAHGSNYSPRQQSQHQHLNPLFSPLPSSTPSGGAHSGLSIGLHHPPASHHSYLMTSPTPSGGSGADGSMQGQHDAYGGSTMQHDSYGSSGFNLPTPMQTSRGVSSLLPSGTGSPSIHGQPNSFLFTPLPPQTPSVFMNLSSHATTGSGVVNGGNGAGVGGAGRQNAPSGNVTMQGNETPLPAGASTNMANYGTQFDWGHTTMRGSPRHQPSANTNSVSTPPPQRFTMSPHVRGSDILGMLSPGGVNGLSAMPISPMMESSLPMLPTVHDIAS